MQQIDEPIRQVTTDGGYDYATCYEAIAAVKARAVIPPRRTGRLNPQDERFRQRDKNLREIRKIGRKKWKRRRKYHRRSLVETAIMRVKRIFGERLSARKFVNLRRSWDSPELAPVPLTPSPPIPRSLLRERFIEGIKFVAWP